MKINSEGAILIEMSEDLALDTMRYSVALFRLIEWFNSSNEELE